jgi:hypothetical protein
MKWVSFAFFIFLNHFSTTRKMGLLTILKKVKQKERELRILILGLDNAG